MKNPTKFLSLILVLTIVVSMFVIIPTSAEENYTINTSVDVEDTATEDESSIDNFIYSVLSESDKTIKITGYSIESITNLVIPSDINGYTVTEIADDAFSNLIDFSIEIKYVTIPETVNRIGDKAFYNISATFNILGNDVEFGEKCIGFGNKTLENYTIVNHQEKGLREWFEINPHSTAVDYIVNNSPTGYNIVPTQFETVSEVNRNELWYMSSFTSGDFRYVLLKDKTAMIHTYIGDENKEEVIIPSEIDGIKVSTLCNYQRGGCAGLFISKPSIKKVIISEGVTTIAGESMHGSFDEVVLPESLVNILDFNSSTKTLIIPKGVKTLGNDNPFSGWCAVGFPVHALEGYTIDEENENFVIKDHALYTKDMKKLIAFMCDDNISDFTIPDGVEEIGNLAFYCFNNLKSVTIPSSVKKIGDKAFAYCNSLEKVIMSDGIELGEDVFIFTPLDLSSPDESSPDESSPEEYTYRISGDNTATITGYTGSATNLNIPNQIDNYTVTEIADNAFSNLLDCGIIVENVTISETVKKIGEKAFYNISGTFNILGNDVDFGEKCIGFGIKSIDRNDNVVSHQEKGIYIRYNVNPYSTAVDYVINNSPEGWDLLQTKGRTWIMTFTRGDYYYTILKDRTALIHQYIGPKTDTIVIPSEIDGFKVSTLYNYLRGGCGAIFPSKVTKVIISEGITTIAGQAFHGAFDEVVLPESLETLSGFNCNCKKMTIPKNVTSLGEKNPFCEICNGVPYTHTLSGITIDNDNKNFVIKDHALYTKDMKKLIAFMCDDDIADFVIPDGVEEIGEDAFATFHNLNSIFIPSSVKKIDDGAFRYCENLKLIKGFDNVISIGDYAFESTGLESVNIPSSVTSIGEKAFFATSLKDIVVDNDNENYSSVDGVLFDKDKKHLISYPKGRINDSYIVPDGVLYIDNNAFCYEKNLNSVILPDSLIEICEKAFYGCNLYDVTIPTSVISIGKEAFYACYNLSKAIIPKSVETIGEHAIGYADHHKNELTIYVEKNSAAKKYAIDNNFNYIEVNEMVDEDTKIEVKTYDDVELKVSALEEKENEEIINSLVKGENLVFSFDISLKKDNQDVQPSTTVQVVIPLQVNDIYDYKIYRLNDDGTKVNMNAVTGIDSISFYTDHFSKYIIVSSRNIGDANKDGIVDINDVTCIQKYLAHIIDDTQINVERAKTSSADLSIVDATRIQRLLANLSNIDGSMPYDPNYEKNPK